MKTSSLNALFVSNAAMSRPSIEFVSVASASPALIAEAWTSVDSFLEWSRAGFERAITQYSEFMLFRHPKTNALVGIGCLASGERRRSITASLTAKIKMSQ